MRRSTEKLAERLRINKDTSVLACHRFNARLTGIQPRLKLAVTGQPHRDVQPRPNRLRRVKVRPLAPEADGLLSFFIGRSGGEPISHCAEIYFGIYLTQES